MYRQFCTFTPTCSYTCTPVAPYELCRTYTYLGICVSPGAEPVLGTEGEDRAAAPSMAENATGMFTAQKSASVATTLADSTSQKRATDVTKSGCSGSKSKYVGGLCWKL